jgi:hypothetical protein
MLDKRASVAFSHIRCRGSAIPNRPTRTNFIATTHTFDYSEFGLLSIGVLFSFALCRAADASVVVWQSSSMWFLANSSSIVLL